MKIAGVPEMHFEYKDLVKIPNILCYIRILLVPVFVWVYLTAEEPQQFVMAAVIVVVSGLTDFLDGQIARRCNRITDIGKIIDPFADKLMQFAMIVCVAIRVHYMAVLVAYLVVKELAVFAASAYVLKKYNKRIDGAKWYGKVCTALLYLGMLTLVVCPQLAMPMQLTMILLCAVAITLSFVMYLRLYWIMARDTKKAGNRNFVAY